MNQAQKTFSLLIFLIFGLMSTSAKADNLPDLSQLYYSYISQAWPESHLRADQVSWLADRSAASLQECTISGVEESFCHLLVIEGLSEVLGRSPDIDWPMHTASHDRSLHAG